MDRGDDLFEPLLGIGKWVLLWHLKCTLDNDGLARRQAKGG
jgi:hypothetical protein